MSSSTDHVTVLWMGDRRRFAKGLHEFPMFRILRRRLRWLVGVGLVASLYVLLSGSEGVLAFLGVELALISIALYALIRRAHLLQVYEGTLTWRIGPDGIHIEGQIGTDIPWSQMVRWYEAGGHLIIQLMRQGRSRMHPGVGAPLEAFSLADLEKTRIMLRQAVGPEDP